jgi:hypothetical protein
VVGVSWLEPETLTVEYVGEPLSRYDVEYSPGSAELRRVSRATLFETSIVVPQPKLFNLAEALGEEGWLKVNTLERFRDGVSKEPGRRPRA